MKYRKRNYYTEADKTLMWDRWKKGDSLHKIAACLTDIMVPFNASISTSHPADAP